VGLPNKSGADCFWLSVLQCMRHTPGFSDCLRRSLLAPRITVCNLATSLSLRSTAKVSLHVSG
jgi:hypothetical protein